jgi:hypothetical protein
MEKTGRSRLFEMKQPSANSWPNPKRNYEICFVLLAIPIGLTEGPFAARASKASKTNGTDDVRKRWDNREEIYRM